MVDSDMTLLVHFDAFSDYLRRNAATFIQFSLEVIYVEIDVAIISAPPETGCT